jgi:hypothetical protein
MEKDKKKIDKDMKEAMKTGSKLVNDVKKLVNKQVGGIKVKYKEGKIVKNARKSIAKGLRDIANAITKDSSKKK